jgi:hypothetical protein
MEGQPTKGAFMKMTPVLGQTLFASSFLFLVLIFSNLQSGNAENQPVDNPAAAKQLIEEGNALNKEWEETTKQYHGRYENLIERTVDAISDHKHALDNGDAKKREEINEAEDDLERSRDGLKRKLAEFTAAKTVDLTKITEDVQERVQDAKD